MRTLLRYYEEWEKRTGRVPNFILKEYLKENLELSPGYIEDRLELALRLVYLADNIYRNSPEQVDRFLLEILTLQDTTRLVISKIEGRLAIRKEGLQGTS